MGSRRKVWDLDDPGDALLYQVFEEPENVDRLAVYADWLIEHGERTRGEYMQLMLLPSPTAAQEKRREALRKKHRGAWLGKARPYLWTWQDSYDSPGFVDWVSCNVGNLAKGIEAIRMLGARCVVSLKPVTSAADRKRLSTIELGRLYGLSMSETDLDWLQDRIAMAIAPKLDGLRELKLMVLYERFTTAGLAKLLATESITDLTFRAGFDAGEIDAWAPAILASARPKLRSLTIPKPSAKWRKLLEKRFDVDYD